MNLRHWLTKSISYLGYFLIVALSGYWLFPVWASWLISVNLPANMRLIEFESDYPGLTNISIQRMVVLQSGRKYSLEGLQLHFDLSDIQLDRLTIEFIEQVKSKQRDSFQLSDLKLPEISVQDLNPLQPLQRVIIGQITVISESHKFQFSQFKLVKPKPNSYTLKISMLHPSNETMVDLTLLLGMHTAEDKISLQVINNESPLFSMSHRQKVNQTTTELRINSDNLQSLLPTERSDWALKTKGDIEIHWLQDYSTHQTNLRVKSVLMALPEQIEIAGLTFHTKAASPQDSSNKIVLTDDDQTSPNELEIPLEFSFKLNLNQPASADIMLTGHINNRFNINAPEMQIDLGPAKFNFITTLNSVKLDSLIKQIKFEKSHIDISGVDFKLQRQQSNVDISEYQLKGIAESVEVDLNDLNNLKWQLKGVFSSPKVVGILIKPDVASSEISGSKISPSNRVDQVENHRRDKSKILRLGSPIEINFEAVKLEEIVTSGELLLPGLQVVDASYRLNGPFAFHWQAVNSDFTTGSASLLFDSVENQIMGFDYKNLKIEAGLSLDDHYIKGEGTLSVNQQSLAPFSFKFDQSSSRLLVDLKKNPLVNQISNHFLTAIGKQNKIALKILAGEMVHSAGVGIDKLFLLNSEIAIKDMLFQFGENQIQGLNVTHKLSSIEPLKLNTQININQISFASGLSINNISAALSSRSIEDISLDIVKANLLEGQLFAENLQIDANHLKMLPFQLKQISLTELIFLIDVAGLYGEGKIDFMLPLRVGSGSVTVDKGRFKAIGPGLIKYSSGQDESAVEENIALQALKNFHYKELDGTLSYNKSSEYHIKLHLLGANPDLYDGYPVDFVLNLKGELSGVFRSLFLTGSFEEAVMQQVKAEQNEKNH